MSTFISEIKICFPHLALIGVALLLGMRHGLDLDHIAIIDAMTRRISLHDRVSRFVGLLFSLGHGLVVTLFCILITVFIKKWTLPVWLNTAMTTLSLTLLLFFGFTNICSLFKSRLSKPKKINFNLLDVKNPLMVIIIGAAFAVSFDTISQAALFSLNAVDFFSVLFSAFLGITFTVGMMLTDGINGYVTFCLLRKASQRSFTLSRLLSFTTGLFSTSIGIFEVMRLI